MQLISLLLEMFDESKTNGTSPRTLTNASITLLLKPIKTERNAGMLAKALACCIETVMPEVVSLDQTGCLHVFYSLS